MDKRDEIAPAAAAMDGADEALTDAQRSELIRRSAAHRRAPHEAVPLNGALHAIERGLGNRIGDGDAT